MSVVSGWDWCDDTYPASPGGTFRVTWWRGINEEVKFELDLRGRVKVEKGESNLEIQPGTRPYPRYWDLLELVVPPRRDPKNENPIGRSMDPMRHRDWPHITLFCTEYCIYLRYFV